MDARETIGRAVAKVKGECWHGKLDDEDFRACLHDSGWWETRCVDCRKYVCDADLRNRTDYTSESNIREAVRVLCVTDRHYDDVLRSIIAHYSLGYMYPRPAGWTFKTLKAVLTAPAEVLVNALLPIAEEVLKEGESDGV